MWWVSVCGVPGVAGGLLREQGMQAGDNVNVKSSSTFAKFLQTKLTPVAELLHCTTSSKVTSCFIHQLNLTP